MFGQTLAIARNTLVESIRQPVFFILVLACGIMQAANNFFSAYSMGFSDSAEVSGDNKMLLDIGLSTVLVCATLLAAFLATSVVSREIEDKTALTVISKPVGRPVFVLGKYLGIAGAIVVGAIAAAMTLAVGHLLIAFVRPMWLKLVVAIAFVAPAAIAGFHATHGIVKHLMPSEAWQIAFSIIGAVAVGITAFVRVAGMATAPGPSGRDLVRA
ncbi:MAG: ABC transporter permease [Phycisphaeraceae bacterium]|nr:ABC transporter permease [Phycisphaeraceae bacterium]